MMACTDSDISSQVSMLLQVHGQDAVDCLEEISRLLQVRVDENKENVDDDDDGGDNGEEVNKKNKNNNDNNNDDDDLTGEGSNHSHTIHGLDDVVGSIGNIVIQTIKAEYQKEEEDDDEDIDATKKKFNKVLYQNGVKVLQFCATIPGHFPPTEGIETLCEVMTKYPQDEKMQESGCIGLSNHVARVLVIASPLGGQRRPSSPTNINGNMKKKNNGTIGETERSKILFTILQAMNWHRGNLLILKSGLSILYRFASPSPSMIPQQQQQQSPNKRRQPPPPASSSARQLSSSSSLTSPPPSPSARRLSSSSSLTSPPPSPSPRRSNRSLTSPPPSPSGKSTNSLLMSSLSPPLSPSKPSTNNNNSNNNNHIQKSNHAMTPAKNATSTLLRARQTQIMDAIELTGGLNLLFQALRHKHSSLKLKRDACRALAALVKDNPSHQAAVAQHTNRNTIRGGIGGLGGLDSLLDVIKLYSFEEGMQQDALQLLASLAYGPESKELLLQKGGLDCILTSMKEHWQSVSIQTTGCRAVANIFAMNGGGGKGSGGSGTPTGKQQQQQQQQKRPKSPTSTTQQVPNGTTTTTNGGADEYAMLIRQTKGSQCIKPLLRAMRMHVDAASVQLFACAGLQTLTPIHAAAVSEAGGIATIMVSIQRHCNVAAVQERGWGTLCNIVSQRTSLDDLLSLCNEEAIPTLLKSLTTFPKHARIQQNGLGCLACLSAREANKQEEIICGKGLDVVLSALYAHGPNDPRVATHCCEILQNLTVTHDFQRAMVAKNGIRILLQTLQRHRTNVGVQLHGSKCLRNLCLDPNNLKFVTKDGGITTIIDVTMKTHKEHTLINAYSCDALGHLALSPQNQVLILAKNGVAAVVRAMKAHPTHRAVQEQGCIFLCHISNNHNAVMWMKSHQVVSILQSADGLLPRSSKVKPLVKKLVKQLQTGKIVVLAIDA